MLFMHNRGEGFYTSSTVSSTGRRSEVWEASSSIINGVNFHDCAYKQYSRRIAFLVAACPRQRASQHQF